MPLRRSLPAALAVLALLTAGVTADSGPASAATVKSSVPVVTPNQALAVVKAYRATVNEANKTYDTSLRDTVEGGAARVSDDADYRLSTSVGYEAYLPIKDVGLRVLVPLQSHYPAVFVALTRTRYGTNAAGKYTYALLFQKSSSQAGWKMTASPSFSSAALPVFSLDKNGYLPALDASTLAVQPAALYPALLKATNLAGAGQDPSAAWALNSIWRDDLVLSAADRVDRRQTYGSNHIAPVCIAIRTGGLCFASAAEVEVDTLTPAELGQGFTYVIDSMDRQYNAGGVAQGSYTMLRTVQQVQAAVLVPRKGASTKLSLNGVLFSTISGTGTLAPSAG